MGGVHVCLRHLLLGISSSAVYVCLGCGQARWQPRGNLLLSLSVFSGSEQKACTPRAEHLSAAHVWPDRRVLMLPMKNLTDDAEGDFQK